MILFVALIALVTIMLAAAALTRNVDTATAISGNLAYKQSATSSADGGLESAVQWMTATDAANPTDPAFDPNHAFNKSNPAAGYYSYIKFDGAVMYADATWADNVSSSAYMDPKTGNTVRYIIERMCRNADQVLSESNCLFSDAKGSGDSNLNGTQYPAKGGKRPINRVTIKVTGPRNTVSYTQAFIY